MDKIKTAVIGVGSMGKNHARIYSDIDSAELVAVADNNEESAQGIASKYKINCYTDYKEMLSKEKIDAVSICVPTKLHKDASLYVAKKKKHMLVEKPIAATIKDALEIINEAEKSNVKLMVGHVERFNPVVIELKKQLEKNELGKLYKVHCVRIGPFVRRITDVGVVVDLAIHEIDVLKYIINSKIKRVYAETSQRIHSAHEDLLIGTIRFENDVLGVINANWLTPKKVRELTITGEKGMFVADYLSQDLFFYENDFVRKNVDYKSHSMDVLEGRMIKMKIENNEPLRNELKAFIDCILKSKNPPVSGKDGLDSLEIAQKFLESSKRNEVISI